MKEVPCFPSIRYPFRMEGGLGRPVQIIARHIGPSTPPREHDMIRPVSIQGRGLVGLFFLGPEIWLVVDWFLDHIHPVEHHTSTFREEEPDGDIQWFGHAACSAAWTINTTKTYHLSIITCYLKKRILKAMWEQHGPPDGDGMWLATALKPRRRRGVLRYNSDPHQLQLWTLL